MRIAVTGWLSTEYRMQCMHDHARIAEPVKGLALTDLGREMGNRLPPSLGENGREEISWVPEAAFLTLTLRLQSIIRVVPEKIF